MYKEELKWPHLYIWPCQSVCLRLQSYMYIINIYRVGRSVFHFYYFFSFPFLCMILSCAMVSVVHGPSLPIFLMIGLFPLVIGWKNGGEVFILWHELQVSLEQLSYSRLWTLGCIRQLIKFIGNPYFAFDTSFINFSLNDRNKIALSQRSN